MKSLTILQIKGQTVQEQKEAEVFRIENNDDRVLQACMKLKEQGRTAVLYTNDKNLASKALINHIGAYRYEYHYQIA